MKPKRSRTASASARFETAASRPDISIKDPNAPPLWARFYEIGTNRPIFSDRDGVAKHDLSEIGYERRNGYAWLGTWPAPLLEKEYPAWKAKLAAGGAKN